MRWRRTTKRSARPAPRAEAPRGASVARVSFTTMAAYDYLCMACEHRFEHRRPMTASVDTALACPVVRQRPRAPAVLVHRRAPHRRIRAPPRDGRLRVRRRLRLRPLTAPNGPVLATNLTRFRGVSATPLVSPGRTREHRVHGCTDEVDVGALARGDRRGRHGHARDRAAGGRADRGRPRAGRRRRHRCRGARDRDAARQRHPRRLRERLPGGRGARAAPARW